MALDLTLILTGIAVERGLFTMDYIENTDDERLKTSPTVVKQPVFVRVDKHGDLSAEAMGDSSVNPVLRDALVSANLPAYCTIYSFRRESIRDTKNTYSTELAKELAGHRPDSNSITYYDSIGLGDADIQALRTKTSGLSRKEAWNLINPVLRSEYVQHDTNFKDNLRKERDERVEDEIRKHPEMGEIALELKTHIDDVRKFLEEYFGVERDIPRGYGRTATTKFKALLQEIQGEDSEEYHPLHQEFLNLSAKRKACLKKLRQRLRLVTTTSIAEEMKSLRKFSREAATGGLRVGGGTTRDIASKAATAADTIDAITKDHLSALEEIRQEDEAQEAASQEEIFTMDGAEDNEDAEEGLDEEVYDEYMAAQNSRSAPVGWEDERQLEAVHLEEEEPNLTVNNDDRRLAFLLRWIRKVCS